MAAAGGETGMGRAGTGWNARRARAVTVLAAPWQLVTEDYRLKITDFGMTRAKAVAVDSKARPPLPLAQLFPGSKLVRACLRCLWCLNMGGKLAPCV